MKKFLSLVLALVMTMSLVTISAGAADFTDDSAINYGEAVDVMKAVEVIGGYADGSFKPTNTLTRGAAAKIICNLLLGPTTAEALVATAAPYSDVPADSTFAGYIAYCKNQGIISGYADGTFKPGNTLTGFAFIKMLLCALGFDQKIEGYVGENWSIAVAKQAQNFDLTSGNKNFVGTKAVTREEACLYALNTLKARPVTYADKGTSITINGAEIVTGASSWSYKYPLETELTPYTLYLDDLFDGDLYSTTVYDAFGREATKWTYDKDEVGTYAKTPKIVFTTAQDKDDVTAALKGYVISAQGDYKINADTKLAAGGTKLISKNAAGTGVTFTSTKSTAETLADATANGKVVEIYTSKNTIVDIVTITYGVAEVTKVVTDKDGNVTYTLKDSTTFNVKDYADPDKDDTVKAAAPMAKDDIVTYVTKGSVTYTYPTTSVTGVVTRVKADDYVVVDGTKYPLSTLVTPDVDKNEQKLVIDQYGVVVDADEAESESKVAYVAKVWQKAGNYGDATWVQVVTQSGEVVEKQLNKDNGATVEAGAAYDFYVTSKDTASLLPNTKAEATYALGASFDSDDKKIDDHNSKTYYFTNDVKFVNVKDNGADIKVTTSTGMQKVVTTDIYMVVDDTDIDVVFVPAAAKGAVDKSSVLFLGTTDIVAYDRDKDGAKARVYEMYKDGEAVEVMVDDAGITAGKFYTYSIDDTTGRYALELVADQYSIYADGSDAAALAIKADKYIDNELGTLYALAKDASFFDLTDNGLASLADIVDFVEANEDAAFEICFTYDDDEIIALYVVESKDLV